jgi:ankyrin repeat protein
MANGRTAVHVAASTGNLSVLRALLQNGGDAQSEDKEGETGLHKAAKECHLGVVRELIQFIHGFIGSTQQFVNKTNKRGETALHYSCMISSSQLHFPGEDRQIVKMLMENSADVTIETESQESAFHYVSHSGNVDILNEILSYTNVGMIQLSVNKQNRLGWAPLLASSSRGHQQVTEVLLANNARVDVFDNEGRSALHLAAESGSMEVCQALLQKNAFVNSKNKNGLTALHYAATKGNSDLVDYLVNSYKATVETLTIKKQTPMHLAAANGQGHTVQALVNLEAMIDSNDDLDQKPIHLAAQHDHTEVVKLFLRLRPSLVSSTTKDGNTLAHLAAKKGSVDVLQAMFDIDKNLVVGTKNRFNDNSPLHLATEGGHLLAVQNMLLNGASANEENKLGLTPIHMAAKCGHADIFDLFGKTGVSLRSPSSKIGMTALHIAAYYGEEDITRELFKHIPAHTKTSLPTRPENALVETLCYESDLSPIHLASYSGSENVVRAVLNQPGVEVILLVPPPSLYQVSDKSSPSGYTALHLACLTGHVGVVGLLISRSTDLLKVTDSGGQTALHVAASHGHQEMCQVGKKASPPLRQVLLGQGAAAHVEDLKQWSALHCAAKVCAKRLPRTRPRQAGFLSVVVLLTTAPGSNTLAQTLEGKVPLWYACAAQHKDCVEFLLRWRPVACGLYPRPGTRTTPRSCFRMNCLSTT